MSDDWGPVEQLSERSWIVCMPGMLELIPHERVGRHVTLPSAVVTVSVFWLSHGSMSTEECDRRILAVVRQGAETTRAEAAAIALGAVDE